VTAFYEGFVVIQFGAFPLVLAVAATPAVNVGLVLQSASQLLAALEPLRAAAEAM
jgi:hypothetical protein